MDFDITLFEQLPPELYVDNKHHEWYHKMMTAAYNQALEDAAEELSELTSDCHVVEGHCAGWKIQKQIISLKKK